MTPGESCAVTPGTPRWDLRRVLTFGLLCSRGERRCLDTLCAKRAAVKVDGP